jgi:uncharacterized protein YdeI (BOF family)
MNLKHIRILAVCTSILGLVVTYFVSENIEPQLIRISEITKSGDYVTIEGILLRAQLKKSGWFFTVKDSSGEMKAVLWDKGREVPPQNSYVRMSGFVKEYKGILELDVKEIEIKHS